MRRSRACVARIQIPGRIAITVAAGLFEPIVWAAGLGALGAIFGSFIAALVIRWPQDRSVLVGRSACDSCHVVLAPADLVPLLSAAVSRGKCRHCGAAIDPVHWQIELTALVIGASAGLVLPGMAGLTTAIFGWLLLTAAAIDWREFWLPDPVTLTIAVAGIATVYLGIAPSLDERLIGGTAGFASLWAIGTGYRLVRGREGLGGGDPKLFGAIGLWIGWRLLPIVLLLASLVGIGVVLFRLLTGRGARLDDRLPFGTLMAIAAYPGEIAMLLLGA